MHMQSNNDEQKYRFFDPFTGEAPLKGVEFLKKKKKNTSSEPRQVIARGIEVHSCSTFCSRKRRSWW